MFVHKIVQTTIYTGEDFYTYFDTCHPFIFRRFINQIFTRQFSYLMLSLIQI